MKRRRTCFFAVFVCSLRPVAFGLSSAVVNQVGKKSQFLRPFVEFLLRQLVIARFGDDHRFLNASGYPVMLVSRQGRPELDAGAADGHLVETDLGRSRGDPWM